MEIGKPRLEHQHKLFDTSPYRPVTSQGMARWLVGKFFEELTAMCFKGSLIPDSTKSDYCSDVVIGPHYIEVKASGSTGETFVYEGRLNKDVDFYKQGHSLTYFIWSHNTHTTQHTNAKELYASIMETIDCLYVVPFPIIWLTYTTTKRVRLNSHNYGSPDNPLYKHGFRFRPKKLFHDRRRHSRPHAGRTYPRVPRDPQRIGFQPMSPYVAIKSSEHAARQVPIHIW